MKNITIVGAGLSGTLLTMNLLRQAGDEAVQIKLVDRRSERDLGPAYSTNEDYLLNVPAEMMGAFSKDPEHFLKWAQAKNIAAGKGDYLPRKLYREYIQSMLQQARDEKSENVILERIRGEVMDVAITGSQLKVFICGQGDFMADKVVLALGNSPPEHPKTRGRAFIDDRRYFQNPWKPDILENLSADDKIIFIGSGQTMVDLATGLYKKKHRGKMVGVSRRGFLPLSQKKVDPYPSFFDELEGQSRILPIFQIVKKHIRIASQKGLDIRAIIDSLRPHTPAIWMQLLPAEKRRFLRHVFRYWEIIRSRIPPESENIIRELQSSGQLKILTGRITDIVPTENGLTMQYVTRDSTAEKTESADMIINCVGPNLDYDQRDEPLIKNLIQKKLIHADPAHLGINALPDGTVLRADGTPSNILFTVGLTLKGIVWEALATPEIRVQAENLASKLLATSGAL